MSAQHLHRKLLKTYGKQIRINSILVFDFHSAILAQLNEIVLVVSAESHKSYAEFMCKV